MADVMTASESKDGAGAGDHDCEYTFGRAREYLTLMQQARLTVIRGFVMDSKRGGEARNCATGDLAYTEQLNSGLIVPSESQKP
jgi:hypothetical protein